MTDQPPEARSQTIRHALEAALRDQPLSARELSQRVGIEERAVGQHLDHLERSLKSSGQRLEALPARCVACGFVFHKRERKARPSRCAQCKSERVEPARFFIAARA
jgi:predicted Zn-ribbon and HTH transcriptional regulator